MEQFQWNQLRHTHVVKQANDPRLKKKESYYYLEHVDSTSTGKVQLSPYANPNWFASGGIFNHNSYQLIRNKAISKVEDELQMFENLFEAFYERDQALAMMQNAGKQILRFVTSWRKPAYWRSLKRGAKRPESLPEAWLMYNFGVKPLVASIDSAIHLLGSDIPPFFVRASSGGALRDRSVTAGAYSRYEGQVDGNAYAQFRVRIQPELNPNRGLLNVMGLTTPFSTAFAVVPWGWAVDYFVNLSDQIANFEDRFPGVNISEVWETNHFTGKTTGVYWNEFLGGTSTNSGSVVHMRRQPSSLHKGLTFNVPMFGSNKMANLFSAIALTMKGKQK